jgi:hypothetical protein
MAEDLTALNKGISELNKNLKYLTGANLFNNARMNEMVEASSKIRDNFEDIDEYTNDTVKNLKEEETKLKATNALKKKQTEIEKKNFDIRQKELTIEQKQLEIKELEEKLARKTSTTEKKKIQIKIDGLKNEVQLTEKINDETRDSIKLDEKECDILKEQTKEYEKQLNVQKKQKTLLDALKNDSKRFIGNIKNLLSGSIGKFLSAGMLIEGLKDAYEMSNKVYDSYWGLSVPLQKANTGMWNLAKKTKQYNSALMDVKFTAARFGYDIDKIAPMMDTLQSKVKYLKKDAGTGIFEWDIDRLSDNAKQIIAISKKMNMESDDMITMLEERVRRFGDTNEAALNSMHSMASATLTFNEIMGQGSVFTEEVGKHLLELHQNTKYWVQDFGMLNTMFNSHVNLLLKQGKHQKEALAIARQFQEGLQQPPDLIKWKAGSKILADIRKEIKGLTDEQAAKKIEETYGLTEGRGKTIVNAIRNSKNTGFTIANILQEELGGTMKGTQATMKAWGGFMGFDSTVLKDMGLASSVADAEKIKQLYKDLSKMNMDATTSMEEAIDKMVDLDNSLSEDARKTKKEELKALLNANKGMAGQEPESPFENTLLKTMKDLKAWLDNPLVKIAGGGVGAAGGIFKESLSYMLGNIGSMLLMRKGGGLLKSAGGKIKGLGVGGWKTITSTPLENFNRLKGSVSNALTRRRYDKAIGKMLSSNMMEGEYLGTGIKGIKNSALKSGLSKARAGFNKFGGFSRSMGGGLIAGAIGLGAGLLTDRNDQREGVNVNNIAQSISGVASALALLNPYSLGITAIANLIQSENEGISSLPKALGATFLSPVNDVVEGVGKIFGQNKQNNRLLASLDDYRKYYTGTMTQKASMTEEGRARLERTAVQRAKNKVVSSGAMLSASIDAFGKGIDIDSFDDIMKKYGITGELETSSRKIQKAGWFGNKSREEYISSKGLDEKGKLELGIAYDAAQKMAEARMRMLGTDYSQKDLEAETQAILEEGNQRQLEQQRELEKQTEFQKDMAKYDETIMKNSSAQRDSLRVLSQKASLDIAKNWGDYEKTYDKFMTKEGKVKLSDGKFVIDGVPSAIAGSIGKVFAS